MKARLRQRVSLLASFAFATLSLFANAQSPHQPTLVTTLPVPIDQEFDAVLRHETNVFARGLGPGLAPYVIEGNVVRIAFDEGCGFICSFYELGVRDYPFRLPALAAGSYIIRIEGGNGILGDFPIVVGGGTPEAIALPVGDGAPWLLLLALVIAGAAIVNLSNRGRSKS